MTLSPKRKIRMAIYCTSQRSAAQVPFACQSVRTKYYRDWKALGRT